MSARSQTAFPLLPILQCLIATFALVSVVQGQKLTLSQFIADTLMIPVTIDSVQASSTAGMVVADNRAVGGAFLGIYQTKKWSYIPVDQYFVLEMPLAQALGRATLSTAHPSGTTLAVEYLSIWRDPNLFYSKAWTLNANTLLIDSAGRTVGEWQWEHRVRKKWKAKTADAIGDLVGIWMAAQGEAIKSKSEPFPPSPYKYRRQLVMQGDLLTFRDGIGWDVRITVDYPVDQKQRYKRGAPGMAIYYRKSSLHESIAIGGQHIQWYLRLHPNWVGRLNFATRIGANSFNTDKFDYIKWWNIILINLSLKATMEYHPLHHKGLFYGIGLQQEINVLPEIVARFPFGIVVTAGVILP